jgi:hypothetical protein
MDAQLVLPPFPVVYAASSEARAARARNVGGVVR